VLRAYARYLRQAGFTFSQAYIAQTLAAHPAIVAMLVAIFQARFDPAAGADREAAQQRLHDEAKAALNGVANLDEDRILRRFLYAIRATIRTNHWVRDAGGRRKPYLSLKIDCAMVPDLPEPRPLFEIFVYSPRFEAIHLRGGKVARGGIRWSDRPEDFRTEVLGLMKAQMVKNAVIVPVGSKGGFVLKAAPPASDREAYLKEGVACYQDFLRGLLDVTDNLQGGKIVPPRDVVRHDPDDPYLVVAADKGTAAFSDYANAVSAEYGHWLGDAFASGGSAGYDHKKMGITARGAWESVKRHFREAGLDTQSQDFTVVGVGDMSGDVFGNGMLLSRHIKLVAAFDHRHIFLDPDPDTAASFRERERLFALPRSSWEDYDRSVLSRGGGVYPRTAKSIALSAEARTALGIVEEALTPQELMKAILKARVDLLYNGGIGTYVKASRQTHADAGDRANDAIRVNAAELRCKVVCEGGNLGFTQLGRIEFALAGGRICTDAIDNSAGVDCSDHEVNIKILLGLVVADGELTEKQRNKLLAAMTDEVGRLVLADNYFQTQSLAVSGMRGEKLLDAQASLIRALEKAGRLNRAVEYLPSEDEIAERRALRAGLTSPERAVLLAYSKMVLYDDLLKGTLVDDEFVARALVAYFPAELTKRYAAVMPRHPLRREIIATVVANSMINRTGSVFVHRMQEETGATPDEVTRAFILVRDAFGFEALWSAIDGLDNRVSADLQSQMLIEAGRLVLRATLWFLRRRREKLPIAQVLAIFQPGLAAFRRQLPAILSAADRENFDAAVASLVAKGVPQDLARAMAELDALYAVLDVTEVAQETGRPLEAVARVYFALAGDLELHWFAERITALPTETSWQALARNALRDDLSSQQRLLATSVTRLSPGSTDPAAMVAAWKERYAQPIARLAAMRGELKRAASLDLAVLSVLLRELRGLA
ncbi:MAG TPA: NAD-glutamate dehydrogenase domain-containing protein, partial [Usitatibacteraceae bacterium]|nr:NAD-glutamate dehydrogenase domain-containing protein [Usitatibacteraceae bacterium]